MENPIYIQGSEEQEDSASALQFPKSVSLPHVRSPEAEKKEDGYLKPIFEDFKGPQGSCYARSTPMLVSVGAGEKTFQMDETCSSEKDLNAYMKGAKSKVRASTATKPKRFKRQRKDKKRNGQKVLEEIGLPDANLKLKMFTESYEMLTNAGYKSIGMDHYAKSTDELSKAFDNHLLHRNFQGYCTRATTGQVYAFGSSSISQLANAYAQNSKNVDDYIKSVNETGFATIRGYSLSKEEEIIRDVINEVMCNGHMSFDTIASENYTTADTVKELIKFDETKLIPYIKDNLMTFDNNTVKVNENGMLVVRNIAMEFDPMLMTGNNLYSKTI